MDNQNNITIEHIDAIDEKQCPIEKIWLAKFLPAIIFLLIIFIPATYLSEKVDESGQMIVIFFALGIFMIALVVIARILERAYFHYNFGKDGLSIRQGVLARQERFIPYSRIQHVILFRDFMDRIMGIASVSIENVIQGRADSLNSETQEIQEIGSNNNTVVIPGLSMQNAEKLKSIIMVKLKENQSNDKSGL